MKLTQQQVSQALQLMGLTFADLQFPLQTNNLEESKQRLVQLKARAKAGFRRAAMDLHPDRTNGDEGKAELFRLVSCVMEEMEKLEVAQRPVMPPPIRVVVVHQQGFNQSATTSTFSTDDVWRYWAG